MADRKFRTDASLEAERMARAAIVPFLMERGFVEVVEERTEYGSAVNQVVRAQGPDGEALQFQVRLCWRRDGRNANERAYAAAQLRARLINDSWEDTLRFIVARDREAGNTHKLIVQLQDGEFVHAALVPSGQLSAIWDAQRERSERLLEAGKLGRQTQNHATNGASPTIWLQDDRTPEAHIVPEVLWSWPGVINVLSLPKAGLNKGLSDDTFDDCPIDYAELGRDVGAKSHRLVSGFPRDARVRAAVLARANGACERDGCGESKPYSGFLDVHHILGVGRSDRVWNCVALCPNCHREAHVSPDRAELNSQLERYALQFGAPN